METQLKVLVVDDQLEAIEAIALALQMEGIEVIALEDGEQVMDVLEESRPDAVLLDQVMPGKSGGEILREIRSHAKHRAIPILMVTGIGGEGRIVEALENGADDYITKPFMGKALAARIRAVVRRVNGLSETARDILTAGHITIDTGAHKVLIENHTVDLTLTEFKILTELLRDRGRVLTRDELRERALGSLNVTDRTIDVHMASLRKKLTSHGEAIQTVRGVGYRFEAEP
jgi:DNA-binding response OmpR family regulator